MMLRMLLKRVRKRKLSKLWKSLKNKKQKVKELRVNKLKKPMKMRDENKFKWKRKITT